MRFACFLSDTLLPVFRARDEGYFAAEGLDVDLIPVHGGPVKLFLTLGHAADPDRKYVWLVASKASGVTSLADVKGKKIAINGAGTGCELAWRGLLADEKEPVISDSVIGTDAGRAENEDTAKAFAPAVVRARDELLANRALVEEAAVKYLDLTPELAKTLDCSVLKPEVEVKPCEVQRLLDALVKAGILKSPLKAEDVSIDLKLRADEALLEAGGLAKVFPGWPRSKSRATSPFPSRPRNSSPSSAPQAVARPRF